MSVVINRYANEDLIPRTEEKEGVGVGKEMERKEGCREVKG